jgi:hypothetical protein
MLLEERLLKRLRQEKAKHERLVMDPYHVGSFDCYRYLVGKINALEQAIHICQETFGKDGEEHEYDGL